MGTVVSIVKMSFLSTICTCGHLSFSRFVNRYVENGSGCVCSGRLNHVGDGEIVMKGDHW